MNKKLTFWGLLLAFCCAGTQVIGQPVIAYPSGGQSLTRGLDTSLLFVDVGFGSACTGINVEIRLSAGISYVPGSVSATGGNGGLTIADNGGTAASPRFLVSNAAPGNNITFTIKRIANCGSFASGKDSVFVTSSCGNASETGAAVNTYNIFAPSLSLTPPSAITNASINSSYNRSFSVTNGGNGCLDTLRLAVVRPSGSVGAASILISAATIVPYLTNGDTSFYKIAGANLPGGDGKMCNGESVNVTEHFTLANCAGLTTTYMATWGRPGNSCQTVSATGIINMATGVPNLTAVYSGPATNNCAAQPYPVTLTITNTGTAPASNLNITVGRGNTYFETNVWAPYLDTASLLINAPSLSGYHPASINVAGRLVGPTSAGAPACALGKVGMLDFNMPAGFMLAAGQSIVVTYNTMTCSGGTCGDNMDGGVLTAAIAYKDQCSVNSYAVPLGTTLIAPMPNFKVNNINSQIPAQVAEGSCFDIKVDASVSRDNVPAMPNGYVEYAVTLPAGFSLSAAVETGSGLSPQAGYPRMVGNKAVFRHNVTFAVNGSSMHSVKFTICTGTGSCGNKSLDLEVSMSRDSTCATPVISKKCQSYAIEVYCGDPCPTGGVIPASWKYYRSNYGLPDNNNDGIADAAGTVDLSKIDLDRYRPGDILHSEYRAYIANQTSPATINNWNYVYNEWAFSNGKFAPSGTATITVKRGASTYSLTGVSISTITAGKAFQADWSSHPGLPGGFTYQAGDSVIIEADFMVDGNLNNFPYVSNGTEVQGPGYNNFSPGIIVLSQTAYASQVANPPATGTEGPDRFTCFIPKYNANVVGLSHFVLFDGINENGATGCNNFDINASIYTRVINFYDGGRYFPYEYRPTSLPDTVVIDIPAGWDYIGQTSNMLYYTTQPAQKASFSFTSLISPVVSSYMGGTRLVYNFRPLLQNNTIPFWGTEGMFYTLGSRIRANCATPASSAISVIESGHWDSYPGSANQMKTAIKSPANTVKYNATSRPVIAVQNNTGVVQGTLPQHYWDIQINSTGSNTAPYVWMALEQGASGITIDSVVLKPSNAVMTANTYAGTKKWYQISAGGITSGNNQQARIYFKYTSCTLDSVKLLAGWNCSGYPSPDPSAGTCSEISTYLKVQPQPSQVQLSLSRQPALPSVAMCAQDSITAIVNSALGANTDNPVITIIPPLGLTINLPVMVEYPLGSNNWQSIAAGNVNGNYTVNLEGHTGIGSNGLPGTINNPASAGRQAKIMVTYTSTCDFVSGSRVGFIINGQTPCGAPATGDGNYISSDPININGAAANGTAGLLIDVTPPELSCGVIKTVPLTITPLSTGTQSGDRAVYTLPAGIEYVTGTFAAGANCTGCSVAVTTGTGNSTTLTVDLPAGISAGTPIGFSVGLRASKVVACGSSFINGEAQRSISGLSCGATACPASRVVIGNANQTVTIKKPSLNITNISFTQSSVATVNYSITLNNNGTEAASAGYLLKIYCGTDASGKMLHSFTTNGIAIGASAVYTGSFTRTAVSCTAGSTIFARIEDTTVNGSASCMCASSTGASSTQVLPVKFTYSKAEADGCNIKLEWGYEATHTSVDRFVVERSQDGHSFTTIAEVGANINRYTDNIPWGGSWHYRIRVTGKDNSAAYSTVMNINAGRCSSGGINIFPNPAKDEIQVKVAGAEGTAAYTLSDMTGRTLQHGALEANGNNRLDVKNFANGIYLLRIAANGSVYTQHIRIVK